MSKDQREELLNEWARGQLAAMSVKIPPGKRLVPASDDASFRRYFRYQSAQHRFIFVDAPPDKEDSRPFVTIAGYLADAGLNAPKVHAVDYHAGFMMLSDLGETLYLSVFGSGEAVLGSGPETLYEDALEAICAMQFIEAELPDYDELLLRQEMGLFPDWLLGKQLGISLSNDETGLLDSVFELMISNAVQQPQVFVHRDYHSRNLMVTEKGNPGIIDFQDAVRGPVTYDLVSLLRDCYFTLTPDQVTIWGNRFRQLLIHRGRLEEVSEVTFKRWFDLMGLQRHLKCAGIFCRLHLRDGKPGYMADVPRVVHYIVEVCREYEELNVFGKWLTEEVEPRLDTGLFKR